MLPSFEIFKGRWLTLKNIFFKWKIKLESKMWIDIPNMFRTDKHAKIANVFILIDCVSLFNCKEEQWTNLFIGYYFICQWILFFKSFLKRILFLTHSFVMKIRCKDS